jgi:hypothetical protein
LATLALAHVTAALLAQENQNPGSPGLAAYIELQGAALGEVSSINAGITASTTRQYGDSFRKSGQAIPEQTTALTAAAQQAFDSNDYYRAFRLNARAAGWSRGPKCLGLVARFPELGFALQPAIARNGALYFGGAVGLAAPRRTATVRLFKNGASPEVGLLVRFRRLPIRVLICRPLAPKPVRKG